MKKTLFALAAVGAFAGAAQAQSSVTVYGNLDVALASTENKTTTATGTVTNAKGRTTGNGDGALSTSIIGFKGTEDMGGGTKANFNLEYDLVDVAQGGNGANTSSTVADTNAATSATTSTGFGARLAWLGLSDAKMGELRVGRQAQLTHSVIGNGLAGAGNNVAGSFYSSGTNSMVNTASVRPHLVFVNRAVTYMSPTFGGLQLAAQTSNQSLSASDSVNATSANESAVSATYTGIKNLSVAAAVSRAENNTGIASQANKVQVQAFTGNYNFGAVQAFGAAVQNKTTSPGDTLFAKTTTYELGLRAPVSPVVTLWASGFTGSRDGNSTTATQAITGGNAIAAALGSADVSGYQVGSVYSFSKRTSMYAIYGNQTLKGKASQTGAKVESTGIALGMRHTF
jgi:predicted porin